MHTRLIRWARAAMPTRDQLERMPLARPLAGRPELWRFTRRSVPRGVAAGLFIGIFALIPGVQIVGAALLCLPLRGNIPLAALMTFVSVPPTTLFVFLPGAVWVGNQLGFRADLATVRALANDGAGAAEWLAWLGGQAAPALILGLAVIALVSAVVGHGVATLAWRWYTLRKRRARLARAARRQDAL